MILSVGETPWNLPQHVSISCQDWWRYYISLWHTYHVFCSVSYERSSPACVTYLFIWMLFWLRDSYSYSCSSSSSTSAAMVWEKHCGKPVVSLLWISHTHTHHLCERTQTELCCLRRIVYSCFVFFCFFNITVLPPLCIMLSICNWKKAISFIRQTIADQTPSIHQRL